MDDEMQAIEVFDPELERRFEAFARLRLSPDAGAVARIRARVMREARLQHEAARIAAFVAPAVDARRRSAARRLAMPLLAASVWTAIGVGTIAAAQAGGALYPARMWIEQAALPSVASARVDADLQHLDDRISEALAAASAGDRGGLDAALEAYGRSAEDATRTSGDDVALGTRVEEALSRHQAVLTALVAGLTTKGNDTAATALERNLERAIEHNAAVLAALESRRDGNASKSGGQGGGNGGGQGGGGANAGGQGGGTGGGNGGGQGGGGANAGGQGGASGGGQGGASGGAGAGGGSGASQDPGDPQAGGGTGSGADSHPTEAPASSPDAPDHTPRAGG